MQLITHLKPSFITAETFAFMDISVPYLRLHCEEPVAQMLIRNPSKTSQRSLCAGSTIGRLQGGRFLILGSLFPHRGAWCSRMGGSRFF
jgi:hypothetical protein